MVEISKKQANKLRSKELRKKWKKKYLKETLKRLPLKFQKNYKSYDKVHVQNVKSSYLFGETGAGKTILSCFMFLKAVKTFYFRKGYYPNIKAYYLNFPDLFIELQNAINSKEESYSGLIKQYSECDILVLDDFAAKKISDFIGDIVYVIINHRYENDKLTIINSNVAFKKLSSMLGDDRIVRRIDETYVIAEKEHYSKSKK